MTVLVLGLATLLGAGWMARRSAPGRRSCLWVLAIGVLTAGQTCWQRDRLASYQVRLLGQRFQPGSDGLVAEVSGDRDRADYYLPGAGNDPVAVLQLDSAGGGRGAGARADLGGSRRRGDHAPSLEGRGPGRAGLRARGAGRSDSGRRRGARPRCSPSRG